MLENQPESTFTLIDNPGPFLSDFLQKRNATSVFLLTDPKVKKHCLPLIKNDLPKSTRIITLPAGEEHKTLESCQLVWKELTKQNADRKNQHRKKHKNSQSEIHQISDRFLINY